MHNYRVYEARTGTDKRQIALSDGIARCQVGRSAADAPPLGVELGGLPARLGLSVLLCVETGRVLRSIVEMIDCDRQATIEPLHPRLTR